MGALGGLFQGILAGKQLRQHMQQEALNQQALQQEMAQRQQEMSARDIQSRMLLDQNSRPVGESGTVSETLDPSSALPASLGRAASDSAAATGTAAPDLDALNKVVGSSPPINVVRPADKSRTVKYGGQSYELLTPQEQVQRQVDRARTLQQGTAIPIQTGGQMGMPDTIYVDSGHLGEYLNATGQNQPVQLGPNGEFPSTVPVRALPSVARVVNNQNTNDTRQNIAEGNNQTQTSVAKTRAGAATDAASIRADATTKAAAIRRQPVPGASTATPGQQGVQSRFNAKQQATDQKAITDLQTKEDRLHAQKIEAGARPTQTQADIDAKKARLAALDIQIRGIQAAKQQIVGKYGSQGAPGQQASPANAPIQPAPGTVPHRNAAGQTIVYNGKAWVDQQTGKPVS